MLRARKLVSAAVTAGLVTMGGAGTTVLSAGAAHATTCPAASQIVTTLSGASSLIGTATSQLGALNPTSGVAAVQAAVASAVGTLGTVSSTLTAEATSLTGCASLNPADALSVANALSGLTGPIQQTVSTLIGAHNILAQFALTPVIAGALQSLEGAFDLDSIALLTAAPSQAIAITQSLTSVNALLNTATSTFSQICIPSPLYPIVPPLCV